MIFLYLETLLIVNKILKLKIPPALQFLIIAALMYGVSQSFGKQFTFPFQYVFAWLFFILGVIVGLISVLLFKTENTSIDPLHPLKASKLITTNIYRYTRNPMYLGLLLILIGLFIIFGNYYNLILLILFVWYITTFQIKLEEQILHKIFGENFTIYCKKTRRWI